MDFLGGVMVRVRGLMGVKVGALVISKVMEIRPPLPKTCLTDQKRPTGKRRQESCKNKPPPRKPTRGPPPPEKLLYARKTPSWTPKYDTI